LSLQKRSSKRDKNDLDSPLYSQQKATKHLSEELKKCYYLLQKLKKQNSAGPFLKPVDPLKDGAEDYFQIVKDPIDLGTIERNLKVGVYQNALQFGVDIRKCWTNSFMYN